MHHGRNWGPAARMMETHTKRTNSFGHGVMWRTTIGNKHQRRSSAWPFSVGSSREINGGTYPAAPQYSYYYLSRGIVLQIRIHRSRLQQSTGQQLWITNRTETPYTRVDFSQISNSVFVETNQETGVCTGYSMIQGHNYGDLLRFRTPILTIPLVAITVKSPTA